MTVPRRIGILTTDTELVVTSWDTALVTMTGIGSADATGRPLTEVIPDLEARGLLRVLREPLESGAARVLAPALHGHFIPCPPAAPSPRFPRMQQRVVIGALRDGTSIVSKGHTAQKGTSACQCAFASTSRAPSSRSCFR